MRADLRRKYNHRIAVYYFERVTCIVSSKKVAPSKATSQATSPAREQLKVIVDCILNRASGLIVQIDLFLAGGAFENKFLDLVEIWRYQNGFIIASGPSPAIILDECFNILPVLRNSDKKYVICWASANCIKATAHPIHITTPEWIRHIFLELLYGQIAQVTISFEVCDDAFFELPASPEMSVADAISTSNISTLHIEVPSLSLSTLRPLRHILSIFLSQPEIILPRRPGEYLDIILACLWTWNADWRPTRIVLCYRCMCIGNSEYCRKLIWDYLL